MVSMLKRNTLKSSQDENRVPWSYHSEFQEPKSYRPKIKKRGDPLEIEHSNFTLGPTIHYPGNLKKNKKR
jgi:hypothetical protein